jgi:hypothetical protein
MAVSIMRIGGRFHTRFYTMKDVRREVHEAIEEALARGEQSGKVACDGETFNWVFIARVVPDDNDDD